MKAETAENRSFHFQNLNWRLKVEENDLNVLISSRSSLIPYNNVSFGK